MGWRRQRLPFQCSASVRAVSELSVNPPTAVHATADLHATLFRNGDCAPAGVRVAWMDQCVPFHASARVLEFEAPTAVHAFALVHATLFNAAPACAGLGVAWMLHLVPFQRSASVPALDLPTAVQLEADVHETPLKNAPPCAGLGVAWMLQLEPFQRSASAPAFELPTAVQADADVQATPFRKAPPCAGLGVTWRLHLVPFHRSANIRAASALVCPLPTAMHADELVHATSSSPLKAIPRGFGVGTMRQVLPFHCSASVTPMPDALTNVPTAMQLRADGHDTQKSWPVGTTGLGLRVTDQPARLAPAGAGPEAFAGSARAPVRRTAAAAAAEIMYLRIRPPEHGDLTHPRLAPDRNLTGTGLTCCRDRKSVHRPDLAGWQRELEGNDSENLVIDRRIQRISAENHGR